MLERHAHEFGDSFANLGNVLLLKSLPVSSIRYTAHWACGDYDRVGLSRIILQKKSRSIAAKRHHLAFFQAGPPFKLPSSQLVAQLISFGCSLLRFDLSLRQIRAIAVSIHCLYP